MLSTFHVLYQPSALLSNMRKVTDTVSRLWQSTATLLALTWVSLLHVVHLRRYKKAQLPDYDDGIVYIHMFPRKFTKKVINLSPYAIKVETWCRMFGIPYQVVETSRFSKKESQIPWMMLNGVAIADSGSIIKTLKEYFKVKPRSQSPESRGMERTVSRMLDDSFSVLYFWYRYYVQFAEFGKYFQVVTAPKFLQSYIRKQIGKGLNRKAHLMGFSRYGVDHSIQLGERDLQSLSDILGDKEYFLGHSPSELDCTVFCHLTQILYPDMPYPWKDYIRTSCPNLQAFCDRMRDRYWPDWDSLVSPGTFQ